MRPNPRPDPLAAPPAQPPVRSGGRAGARRAWRPAAAVTAIALIVTACGSSPATSAPTATVAAANASASVAPVATPAPSDAASVPSVAIPSLALPSAARATDLEALLPDSVDGVKLAKSSMKGLSAAGSAGAPVAAALAQIGKTPNDVSIALAIDPTGKFKGGIIAYQIAGIDANNLLQIITGAITKERPEDKVSQTTVGGKNVTLIAGTGTPLYLYPSGSVIFAVTADNEATANAAFAALH